MTLTHLRRGQAGVDRVDARAVVRVDDVGTIYRQDLGGAREVGRGRGRAWFRKGHADVARRRALDDGPARAVAHVHAGLRKRLPLRGRISEVELVLRRAGGRDSGTLQQQEILRRRVGGGIGIGHLAIPQVKLVRPRAQPVVLIDAGAGHVRIRHTGVRISARARRSTPCGKRRRRLKDTWRPGARAACGPAAASTAPTASVKPGEHHTDKKAWRQATVNPRSARYATHRSRAGSLAPEVRHPWPHPRALTLGSISAAVFVLVESSVTKP